MHSFRHVFPQMRFYQGSDCLEHLPSELARLKRCRAVVVCGQSISESGSLSLVRSALDQKFAGVYAGARANSPLADVLEAAAYLREMQADAAVAVGGGSAIVTARAASILLAEGTEIHRLCTHRDARGFLTSPKLLAAKIPQFVIPTTPTTAITKAGSAVLDPDNGGRLALYDPKTRAEAIFIHPQLIESAPRELFTSAGVNSLTLAIEGLLSRSANPLSDALLMHAIRLLARGLPRLEERDNDFDARIDLMLASILSGRGSDATGAGLAIPLGHAIGARCKVDSGSSDAIVLPHVVRFNAPVAQAGILKLAEALGIHAGDEQLSLERVLAELSLLFCKLHLPARLRDIGVERESIPQLANVTMDDWFVQNNPRRIENSSEIEKILESAW